MSVKNRRGGMNSGSGLNPSVSVARSAQSNREIIDSTYHRHANSNTPANHLIVHHNCDNDHTAAFDDEGGEWEEDMGEEDAQNSETARLVPSTSSASNQSDNSSYNPAVRSKAYGAMTRQHQPQQHNPSSLSLVPPGKTAPHNSANYSDWTDLEMEMDNRARSGSGNISMGNDDGGSNVLALGPQQRRTAAGSTGSRTNTVTAGTTGRRSSSSSSSSASSPCKRSHVVTPRHDDVEIINNLMDAKSLRETVTLYVMEFTISVHSIIIGLDIGLLSRPDQIPALVSLICAISFHQFVEGLGLGTILRTVKGPSIGVFRRQQEQTQQHVHKNVNGSNSNSHSAVDSSMTSKQGVGIPAGTASTADGPATGMVGTKMGLFVCIFCSTTPIGILIGILTSAQAETNAHIMLKGAANAIAAGSLLYISLAEMVAHYFSALDVLERPQLKLLMIAMFTIGIGSMAVLAIWA